MLTNQEPWTKNCGTKLNWFYSPLLYYINVLVWKILNYIEASVVVVVVVFFCVCVCGGRVGGFPFSFLFQWNHETIKKLEF